MFTAVNSCSNKNMSGTSRYILQTTLIST